MAIASRAGWLQEVRQGRTGALAEADGQRIGSSKPLAVKCDDTGSRSGALGPSYSAIKVYPAKVVRRTSALCAAC